MKDEALRLALEALESYIVWFSRDTMIGKAMRTKAEDSITAIREALAQPEQEPVFFCDYGYEGWEKVDADMAAANLAAGMTVEVYYTTPPKREPLTNEEIDSVMKSCINDWGLRQFARAIEAAHGIKGEA